MEPLRSLGRSGLRVPALGFGAGTFGGRGELFGAWGSTDVAQAREIVARCVAAGVTLFDTADVYSDGASEEVLGAAVKGRRDEVLISTKAGLAGGTSRSALLTAVDKALTRLDTDHIDLFHLHALDAATPAEEVLSTLDDLVRAGKVRYVGVSNFPGWALQRSLDLADRHGWPRYVSHQVYYSLVGRDYEWDLMPLGAAEGVGAMVWSPLGWGRLTGRIRRDAPIPPGSRLHATAAAGPPVADDLLFAVVDALDQVAAETGRSVPQIALNWLTTRPTVGSVIIGARDVVQLEQNLGAVGWTLEPEHLALLDRASHRPAPYPHFPYERQEAFAALNPPLVGTRERR
ncbi:aldo/keto reductase [Pseudonocardia sp. WMMC193]|uniref:aldo/keto reductase n=1 Tax=Pseudonocardia sp. WMMC193 TaxID=2911965 RepID=UPI001F234C52|nr:aldo/keto reductase [Pseudonocardia sp. WMMC193]MCF7548269.1 aldo/keto reductase [Pseudonocardia sp. WMMC193]